MKILKKFNTFIDFVSVISTYRKCHNILKTRFLTEAELENAFIKGSRVYKKSVHNYLQAVKDKDVLAQKETFPLFYGSSLLCLSAFQQKGAFYEANQVCQFLLEHLEGKKDQEKIAEQLRAQIVVNDFRLTLVDIEKNNVNYNQDHMTKQQAEDLEVYKAQLRGFYQTHKSYNFLGEVVLCQLAQGREEEAIQTLEEFKKGTHEQNIENLNKEIFGNAGLFHAAPHIGAKYREHIQFTIATLTTAHVIKQVNHFDSLNKKKM